MNNLKDINANELSTIRIALLDKIDNINKYIEMAKESNQPIYVNYWKESLDKHTTLLDKLY